jgi:hypothetical protein
MRTMLRAVPLGLVVLALAATAAAAGTDSAKLAVPDTTPLIVRGIHFAPGELVTVTATYRSLYEKRVRAGSTGTFRVRFRLSIEQCAKFGVSARGDRGSRAWYKSPIEECGTPIVP